MKMNIKELKERGEKDDKVKFSGKVKNVYDAKEAVTKYTVSRQNIIIEDETDSIKVIVSHKTKEMEYSQDIVGKEIEVDGKISIWEGKKNIFGKLVFKEGEAPAQKGTASKATGSRTQSSTMPIIVEVRKSSLRFAMDFWIARIGDKMEESKIIKTANVFYLYLTGKANITEAKAKVQKIEEQEKEENAETKKEGEEIKREEEMSAKKAALINTIMELKEKHHVVEEVFTGYCDGKNIKALSVEELEKVKKILNELTEDIPF